MSDISSRIKELVEHFAEGNNSRFAKLTGTSEANIRNYINGRQPKFDFLSAVADKFEINYEWLFTGVGEIEHTTNIVNDPQAIYGLRTDPTLESQQIPLYDIEAAAGLIPLFKDPKSGLTNQHLTIPGVPKCDGAVFVTGDSMYPLLKSGDIIAYKEIKDLPDQIFWGEMYLLSIDYGEEEYVTVKWVQKSEKGIEYIKLVSENRHHQPKDVQLKKVRAMAIIKASVRINSMA